MKTQVIIIGGGDTFETYEEYLKYLKSIQLDLSFFTKKRWKNGIQEKLGKEFEVIRLEMPNDLNAKYIEWKIWFEKLFPFVKDNVIILGHSLGGIFLAKYLSENIFPKKIRGTILVAPPFDEKDADYVLTDFTLPSNLTKFESQGGEIHIYHSEDDPVVPFAVLAKYKKKLLNATEVIFKNRGHFLQPEFPEIIKDIKKLSKMK